MALVDPVDDTEFLIAEDLEDSAIREINNYIWSQLDDIAHKLEKDPELGANYGGQVARQLYLTGYNALQNLLDYSSGVQVSEVQEFCSRRIGHAASAPSIIDVVADERDHIFFEVMPLLGKSTSVLGNSDIAETASVMAGFNAIVRHSAPQISGSGHDSLQISVRFFRNAGLGGSTLELRRFHDLQRKGKMRIALEYPPKGFRAAKDFPEGELARTLADPWFLDTQRRLDTPGSVCHFSCHLTTSGNNAFLELMPDGRWAKTAKYRIDWTAAALDHADILPPKMSLCFLSVCRSAAVDRDLLVSAMDALRHLRPESIVGTLGSTPDSTAAKLAFNFYELLGEGWSVGAALWQAKKNLLEAPFYNPLGLLYVSYHGEDAQFLLPADRRQHLIPDELAAILSTP